VVDPCPAGESCSYSNQAYVDCSAGINCSFTCSGEYSCKNLTCGTGTCTILCSGYHACDRIMCGPGSCNVVCESRSCTATSIFSTGSGSLNLQCNGESSCEGSHVQASASLTASCDGLDACSSSRISCGTGSCDLDCSQPHACDSLQPLQCGSGPCSVNCGAAEACNLLQVNAAAGPLTLECGDSACTGLQLAGSTGPLAVNCYGNSSCLASTFTLGSNLTTVVCTQSQSCDSLTINAGSGLVNLTCANETLNACAGLTLLQQNAIISETNLYGVYYDYNCTPGLWQCSSNLAAPDNCLAMSCHCPVNKGLPCESCLQGYYGPACAACPVCGNGTCNPVVGCVCSGTLSLFENNCLPACPEGYISVSNICQGWSSLSLFSVSALPRHLLTCLFAVMLLFFQVPLRRTNFTVAMELSRSFKVSASRHVQEGTTATIMFAKVGGPLSEPLFR